MTSGMSAANKKNIASIVGEFGRRLLGFIRRRVDNEADAEDILQDIWYQLTMTVDAEPIEQMSDSAFAAKLRGLGCPEAAIREVLARRADSRRFERLVDARSDSTLSGIASEP